MGSGVKQTESGSDQSRKDAAGKGGNGIKGLAKIKKRPHGMGKEAPFGMYENIPARAETKGRLSLLRVLGRQPEKVRCKSGGTKEKDWEQVDSYWIKDQQDPGRGVGGVAFEKMRGSRLGLGYF